MANVWFSKGLEAFAAGNVDWDADTFKLCLVNHAVDVPDPLTDQFLSDIASGARVAISGALAGKTNTGGVLDANDIVFTALTGGTVSSVVLFKDTGTVGTSPLLVFIDTGTSLPFTPVGGDVTIQFDEGASKIAKL